MGSRLCINILNKNKIIGNCYWQSSGYFNETMDILGRLIGKLLLQRAHYDFFFDKKKRNKKFEYIWIFDFFSSLGCGYNNFYIDENTSDYKIFEYIYSRREFHLKEIIDSSVIFAPTPKKIYSNLSYIDLSSGYIGLGKMIESNIRDASFIIDVHLDKRFIDLKEYFYSYEREDVYGKSEDVYTNIVPFDFDIKKIPFQNVISDLKPLLEGYLYRHPKFEYTTTFFFNKKTKKYYRSE